MGRSKSKKKTKEPSEEMEQEVSMTLKEQGDSCFKRKAFLEAIKWYTEAVDEEEKKGDEALSRVYSNRSAAYSELSMFKEAVEDAEKVIVLLPEWSKGYSRKAHALEGLLQFEEALEANQSAFALDPMNKTLEIAVSNTSYNILIQWLLRGRAEFPKLYLQYYNEEFRGVHCSTNIPPDEIIMQIPLNYIMTTEMAKESEIGQKLLESGLTLSSQHSYLACFLLQERAKESSFWDPYLRCLPTKYSNMPINFTDEEKRYLKGSFSIEKMEARVESLEYEYNNICDHITGFEKIASLEDFIWARHVVITRIFGMSIEKDVKTNGLVPMADMLNHKQPRETKWTFDRSRRAFTITALRQLHQGEQVFDSYGRKCNSRFFVNYGFALEDNSDNETVLRFVLDQSDPLFPLKQKYIGPESLAFQIPADLQHEKTLELFSFARWLVAKNEDVKLFFKQKNFALDKIIPITLENEGNAISAIKEASKRCLDGFETSLEEDEYFYRNRKDELSFNVRNCYLMRMGEKRVCHFFIDFADLILPLISSPLSDFKANTKKIKKNLTKHHTSLDWYFQDVILPLQLDQIGLA